MGRPTRWLINHLALAATAFGVSLALLLGTARFLSEPAQGSQVARRNGIPRPAIIAHRGASYWAPEATRPAYLLARELGADYLEVDLQRTRDGVLVAVHDPDLSRTTNVSDVFPERASDPLRTFTYQELLRLDAGRWFNERFPARARASFAGLQILRLEEVLDLAGEARTWPGLYIEFKDPDRYPGIEEQTVGLLSARGWMAPRAADRPGATPPQPWPARVIFQCFDRESLARLDELAPGVPRVLLMAGERRSRTDWEAVLREAAQVAEGVGPWGYRHAYGAGWSADELGEPHLVTWPWHQGAAHRAGLVVHPWTVDEAWEMWMLRLGGADGLFTNRTERAVRIFKGREAADLETLWARIGY